jgi:hypothetical protein
VQAGYKAQPLSAFLKQPAPKIDFLPATSQGTKENFLGYLAFALQFVPRSPEDKEVRAKLAIEPGKPFEFKNLSPENRAAIVEGMKAGDEKVEKFLASGMKTSTGGALVRSSAIAPFIAAIGCCVPARPKPAFTATMPPKPRIPFAAWM